MTFEILPLPYLPNSLEPFLSEQTIFVHYEKHYKKYIEKLNKLIAGTPFEKMPMTELIEKSYLLEKVIFHNAAQARNHMFFFNGLKSEPTDARSELREVIEKQFGSRENLKKQFLEKALEVFGSGWMWLLTNTTGKLWVEAHLNAGYPFQKGETPLLVCDLWEHAYYLEFQNDRAQYLEAFWKIINWQFVSQNYLSGRSES